MNIYAKARTVFRDSRFEIRESVPQLTNRMKAKS
jgi:hypothetical protein